MESSKSESLNQSQEIEYNTDGQPVFIRVTEAGGTEHQRVYKDGKLQLIITTRKKMPDFFQVDQLDSLDNNGNLETDTATIVDHGLDGRPSSIKGSDGTMVIFEYEGCDREMITTLSPTGDTIQQIQNTKANGVLVEQTWTPFFPEKSSRTTTYFDYQLNDSGHWIERRYKVREGTVTESRELSYY